MRRRWLKRALVLLVLWALSHLLFRLTRPPLPARPVVIAHRGGAALAPENTLSAFRQAQSLQADFLETDVRQTADGQLVLMHDDRVDRTTEGQGPVERLTTDQARRLGIATFAEFLQLARTGRNQIMPEVKGGSPDLEEAFVQALDSEQMRPRTLAQSFRAASLERLHRLAPDLRLVRPLYLGVFWLPASPEGVVAVSPNAETLLLCPWMVRAAHARGYQVWPWFAALESQFTVDCLLGLGVDGLMLDDPRRMARGTEPR